MVINLGLFLIILLNSYLTALLQILTAIQEVYIKFVSYKNLNS